MLERTIKIPLYTPPAQGSWVLAFLAWSFVIQSLNVLTADRYLPLHKQNSSNLNYLEKELSSIPNQLKICIKIQIMLKNTSVIVLDSLGYPSTEQNRHFFSINWAVSSAILADNINISTLPVTIQERYRVNVIILHCSCVVLKAVVRRKHGGNQEILPAFPWVIFPSFRLLSPWTW